MCSIVTEFTSVNESRLFKTKEKVNIDIRVILIQSRLDEIHLRKLVVLPDSFFPFHMLICHLCDY